MAPLVIKDDKLGARQPHFFKVFLPHVNSQCLHVPSGFVKQLKGKTSGSVFLTGPSGNTWQVNFIQKEDGLFFHEGWSAFAKDHFAEYGDFFVFKYNGDFDFIVMVFDKSACEKEAAFHAKCTQDISNFVRNKGNKRVKLQENASSHEAFEGVPKSRTNTQSKATYRKNEDGGHELSMWEGTHEKKATHRPFFVSRMTKGNVKQVFILYLPPSFVMEHFPSYKNRQIVLRNQEGNQWIVKLIRRASCGSFCAGWPAFVRDNRVKEGDTCRFELVSKFEMLVHIARKNRESQQVVA
ncbi:hypothetical protein ACSBR1_008795 [Camellia fascicularis]